MKYTGQYPCQAQGADQVDAPCTVSSLSTTSAQPSQLAEALLGEGGHEAVLNAQDDVCVVAARSFLFQQPARQQ